MLRGQYYGGITHHFFIYFLGLGVQGVSTQGWLKTSWLALWGQRFINTAAYHIADWLIWRGIYSYILSNGIENPSERFLSNVYFSPIGN
jgi:hypothetical protein